MRFWAGILSGVAASAIAALVAGVVWVLPRLSLAFDELGDGGELPQSTELVLSHAWQWGAPGVLALLLIVSNIGLRQKDMALVGALSVISLASLAVLAYTGMALYLPLFELAGDIAS